MGSVRGAFPNREIKRDPPVNSKRREQPPSAFRVLRPCWQQLTAPHRRVRVSQKSPEGAASPSPGPSCPPKLSRSPVNSPRRVNNPVGFGTPEGTHRENGKQPAIGTSHSIPWKIARRGRATRPVEPRASWMPHGSSRTALHLPVVTVFRPKC